MLVKWVRWTLSKPSCLLHGEGGRGLEVLNKRFNLELRPKDWPVTLLYINFDKKGTSYGISFTYLVLENCILSNFFKRTVFNAWMNHKTWTISHLFTAIKCIFYPLWAFLQTGMTTFPNLSYTSTSVINTLFYTWSRWERYPWMTEPRPEPPCMGNCKK